MFKRVGVFFLIFLVLFSGLALAQDTTGFEDSADEILDTAEKTQEFLEEEKWEYLSEQWEGILLNNTAIANIDSGLRNVDPVIFVAFGEHYDLSMTFLFTVLLWVAFFVILGEIFSIYGLFSPQVGWLIGFIIAVVIGHLGIYTGISLVLFKLIFFREGAWGWISFVLVAVAYVIIMMFAGKVIKSLSKKRKEDDKKKRARQQRTDQDVLRTTVGAINRAYDIEDEV